MSTRNSTLHNYEYIASCSHIPTLPSRFSLAIRQQPIQTRQTTTNERDRRPVDPPPILQIKLVNATIRETQDFLQNPYFFMGASLVRAETSDDNTSSCLSGLAGQTVSSMYKLKDYDNNDGGFFVFGDLSVRIEGQYRLRFTLFEITTQGAINLKSIYSDIFSVYSAKTFPGMLESTFLSRTFSDQGVRLRIRKEHRVQMAGSRKRKMSTVQQDDTGTASSENSSVGNGQKSPYHSPNATSVSWYWPPPQFPAQQQQQRSPPRVVSLPQQHYHSYSHQSYINNKANESSSYFHQRICPPPSFSASSTNKSPRRLIMNRAQLRSSQNSSARQTWSFSFQHNAMLPLDDQDRMAEQDDGIDTTPQSGGIQLPPIRNIINTTIPNHNSKGIGEVDAAVAMMQLASLPQQQSSSQMAASTTTTNTRAVAIHPSAYQRNHYHHHHHHPSTTSPCSGKAQSKKSTVW